MAEKKISKLVANLELNEFKLNSLLEITKGINNKGKARLFISSWFNSEIADD